MPNKTIYVSDNDASLFEQAKDIAGEALSSVIVRALREYISRNLDKKKGMKEVALKIGHQGAQREQRFIASFIGKWNGFSDDKQWYLNASIYRTQKDNWAIYLETVCKASLLTNKNAWKASGDFLLSVNKSELLVGTSPDDLKKNLPTDLFITFCEHAKHFEQPVEYLDI